MLVGRRGARILPRFVHRMTCHIFGMELKILGQPDPKAGFLVSNHISYLDIPVIGSVVPGSFIAKAEVADWPLFGFLARLQNTVFIRRDPRHAVAQVDLLTARLKSGDRLILFAEGTSTDGRRVRPFKPALFAGMLAADQALPDGLTIQPLTIACTRLDGKPISGAFRPLYTWFGDLPLLGHLWPFAGLGRIGIDLVFHEALRAADFADRKALARRCQAMTAAGLAACLRGDPDSAVRSAIPEAMAICYKDPISGCDLPDQPSRQANSKRAA